MAVRRNVRVLAGWLLVAGLPALAGGCSPRQDAPKKQLLIYCGITMVRPMSEIARIIERQENCQIIVMKGGSGNLLRSLRTNKVGDLYLPGSDSYMETCLQEGLVTETAFVGHNKAAMMVRKGNPRRINADLSSLTHADHYVVIGNADSGSIGRETKAILERKGIYEAVQRNAQQLTMDSKDLARVLRERVADLVINWYAVSTWPENRSHMDVLPIDERYARKKKLVLGVLKTTRYPQIARKFMQYAASEQGKALFRKYGLYDVQ
jgi:molybdate transport system substrate-binding protein